MPQNIESKHGPIFIGGPDRCGKTTMRAYLASHPNICIPAVGSNMWTYFYDQYGDLGKRDNFERCLDAMLHYKHVLFLKPNPDRIRKEFWQGAPTYARLFSLFLQHFSEQDNKPRWGDQTGLVERYADQIFEAIPTAKFIHMLRDPRDRYEASLSLWPNGKGRAGGATARWLYSAYFAKRNLRKFPERYKVVLFEDLIRNSEKVIREVCLFLDEEYFPGMMTMEGAPTHREKLLLGRNHQEEAKLLSDQFIGFYRGKIPDEEIAYMQSIARKQISDLGYPLDTIRFPLTAWLKYIFYIWPLNWVRMTGWISLELLQHFFPSIAGRQPSKKMVVKDPKSEKIQANAA